MRSLVMGVTGLTVPAQGLGCMRLTASRAGGRAQAIAVINRALDLGVTFLDTADMYGGGANEELVGAALRYRRDEAVLCTKFGVVPEPGGGFSCRGDAEYVRSACDASLRRLGTDVIDLYYLHDRDGTVPIDETVGAMAELVTTGKVRHLGLSNIGGEELRAATAVHPIAALQSEWSLVSRTIEAVVPICAELGVGVVPFCPQGAGLLLGRDEVTRSRLVDLDTGYAVVADLLSDLAREHGATSGQIALAWVHQRAEAWGVAVAPIPGTTRLAHLEQNVAALAITLDGRELAQLDRASQDRRPRA